MEKKGCFACLFVGFTAFWVFIFALIKTCESGDDIG